MASSVHFGNFGNRQSFFNIKPHDLLPRRELARLAFTWSRYVSAKLRAESARFRFRVELVFEWYFASLTIPSANLMFWYNPSLFTF